MKCNFLLLTLCVFSAVSRTSPSLEPGLTYCPPVSDLPDNLRFSPSLVNIGVHNLMCFNWRRGWKLRYLHSASHSSFLTSCLLLLSGDVEVNPRSGPRHPCGSCSKAVRSSQRGSHVTTGTCTTRAILACQMRSTPVHQTWLQ